MVFFICQRGIATRPLRYWLVVEHYYTYTAHYSSSSEAALKTDCFGKPHTYRLTILFIMDDVGDTWAGV